MSERYSKLFSLPGNLYAEGAPVILSAGNLLKDNETGKILAQLKLKSISPKTIKAVKVRLFPAGKPLGEAISHEYLDLRVEQDGEFGQKSAVFMPSTSTRAFSAEPTEVVFTDNSIWTAAGNAWESLPAQEGIGDWELLKQYLAQRRNISPFGIKTRGCAPAARSTPKMRMPAMSAEIAARSCWPVIWMR